MKLIKITLTAFTVILFTAVLQAEISVIKVEGSASYKEGNKWLPLKVNQKLSEGVKVSTGANSYADIMLNSLNHTVRIKPFTVIQVFSKESETDSNTHIGLKRGGVIAKVPRKSNVKTIFKVSTPIATSSVRGTEEEVTYGPGYGMVIKMLSGTADGENRNGQKKRLSGKLQFHQSGNNPNPGNPLQNIRDGIFIPVSGNGLTGDETAGNNSDQTGSPDDDNSLIDDQVNLKSRTTVIIDWGNLQPSGIN